MVSLVKALLSRQFDYHNWILIRFAKNDLQKSVNGSEWPDQNNLQSFMNNNIWLCCIYYAGCPLFTRCMINIVLGQVKSDDPSSEGTELK